MDVINIKPQHDTEFVCEVSEQEPEVERLLLSTVVTCQMVLIVSQSDCRHCPRRYGTVRYGSVPRCETNLSSI